tara:strand:- start:327 stop:1064 length:738 start_codon:yes stop_codon:yes gene_type:complete
MRRIFFKKIAFLNVKENELNNLFKKKGLFVFPSGPGLSTINREKTYLKSLIDADYVFFDSGYFVILLRIIKNIKVNKISGYLFLLNFFKFLKKNKHLKILSVDPNLRLSKSNFRFLKKIGLKNKNLINYIAPIYKKGNIKDYDLIKLIKKNNPNYIILNIGGNVQEILGSYINKKLNKNVRIFCTGAAISFFSGDQAPINKFLDRIFLGWLIRILYKPSVFFSRYLLAIKLIFIVLNEKIKISKS